MTYRKGARAGLWDRAGSKLPAAPKTRRRNSGGCERLPKHVKALGNRGPPVFLPLEFQRDVPPVVVLAEHLRDALVVKVQGVPEAAAEIGLGLHEAGLRGHHLQ